MTFENTCRAALFAGIIASLAACGNDERRDPVYQTLYTVATDSFGPKEEPEAISDAAIAQTLAATDLPALRLRIDARKSEAIALEIERNGVHRTYATAERQSIILHDGFITATRGLGGDLMSVEEDALLNLLRARRAGQADYTQRYLTPEDLTEVLSFRCNVAPGQSSEIAQGEIRTTVTVMRADCTDGVETVFTDSYLVDGSGEIVTSRQWLGKTTGYMTLQQLRR